jgi:outer membrane protein OmpA-like peptidoglycan-associated protein
MNKRNVFISVILVMTLCISMVCLMTDCSDTGNEEIALAVVGSPHSNEPSFPLDAASIKDKLYNCCYAYGSVSFITNDGNPKVVYQTDIPKPEKSGLSENKKKTIATNYTSQLLKELSKLNSDVSEVDTLKAITYASKTLSSSSPSADKVLVIMDNGLSTVGYLDFTKGLLYADTKTIVDALNKVEAIPDLTDVNVVWMYLGQTAAPQQELSEVQKHKLEEIWRTILTEGGAKSIEFVNDIASDEPDNNLPSVSVVDVQNRSIDIETSEEPVEIIIEEPIETIVLDNTSVRFIGDKAEFVDYEEASSVLAQYAQILLEHPNNKVYVIGTTATGSTDFCNELSVNRANAVCQVLISYGVPESQLIPLGMGFEDPWHIDDVDDNDKQIEEYACQNRKVLIVDVNGDDASKLK